MPRKRENPEPLPNEDNDLPSESLHVEGHKGNDVNHNGNEGNDADNASTNKESKESDNHYFDWEEYALEEEEEDDEEGNDEVESLFFAGGLEEDHMILPREVFVLYTEVTDLDPNTGEVREGTLVVHNDRETEALYALCFESLDAANDIQKEFEEATGEEAMVRRISVIGSLEDYFRIRFYHANGHMEDLTQNQYHERCL